MMAPRVMKNKYSISRIPVPYENWVFYVLSVIPRKPFRMFVRVMNMLPMRSNVLPTFSDSHQAMKTPTMASAY